MPVTFVSRRATLAKTDYLCLADMFGRVEFNTSLQSINTWSHRCFFWRVAATLNGSTQLNGHFQADSIHINHIALINHIDTLA
jgi:hypothetical protein